MRRATEAGTQLNSMLIFQSTLSMRRATVTFSGGLAITEFQSTLSMRRATLLVSDVAIINGTISIHALHEESDAARYEKLTILGIFQSTLSMRRATPIRKTEHGGFISIHALHEESDRSCPTVTTCT